MKSQRLPEETAGNAFLRRFRRAVLFLSIFIFLNYRYWTGKQQFPLICNITGISCPKWPVIGEIATGYEEVVHAFKANFLTGKEIGASFTAYVGSEKVLIFVKYRL
jgi:hypothetical protein